MNFTNIYQEEKFYKNKHFDWIECTDIGGTNCYCDKNAENEIKRRIKSYSPEGVHFIDSGNYHYISKFWTDKIKVPFTLVVFDHHPDMQPTLFENLMSCGCWVKEVLDHNLYIKKVVIVGAKDELLNNIDKKYKDRIIRYSETDLKHKESWRKFANEHVTEPIYISIDKDILSSEDSITNWDQGSIRLPELKLLFEIIVSKQKIIGIDICGECANTLNSIHNSKELMLNDKANKEILDYILSANIY